MPNKVLSPILTVNKNVFEKVFKDLMKTILTENKINVSQLTDLNRELNRWLIIGMKNVDFDDKQNALILNELVDSLWEKFYRNLNLELIKYKSKFKRKQL